MHTSTTSRDGTPIAFERLGDGDPLIVVGGILNDRRIYRPTAEALAEHFAVVTYDRRGRGDSGDTAPYAVEREVEDLAALLQEADGEASLYGHSSGAALVLHAASRGLPISAIVLHEPPFGSGSEEELSAERAEAELLAALLAADRRGEAVSFLLTSMGMPVEVAEGLAQDPAMLANAPSILHDYEVMSPPSRGAMTPASQAADVDLPTLVLVGGASPEFMLEAGRLLAEAAPQGQLRVLDGQEHVVPPDVLAPVVAEFLTRR